MTTRQPTLRYAIELLHANGEWENVTRQDGDDETPVTYATRDEAADELSAHFRSMSEAGMDYSAEDYRIVAAYPPVDKNQGSIYADTMNALQAADELGGCNDAGEYIALMQAVIAECQTRILCAKANYYADGGAFANEMAPLPDDEAAWQSVLGYLYDAGGAVLHWQMPDAMQATAQLMVDAGRITLDASTDLLLHPDARQDPTDRECYYIPHQDQR
jgi:hypothetical protein